MFFNDGRRTSWAVPDQELRSSCDEEGLEDGGASTSSRGTDVTDFYSCRASPLPLTAPRVP
jgi:hypothetical protein